MSISSKASNMLLAKCRARYGRRLTMQDADNLMNCRTVAEAAAYLKSGTKYAEALMGIDENNLRRERLGHALQAHLYSEFDSLCRCEESVGDWFGEYVLMRIEIRQIMSFLWLLYAGRQSELILSAPELFLKSSKIDPNELSRCNTYSDFLSVMRHSHFIKVLRAFAPLPDERIDCALIEHALYAKMYSTVNDIISKHYSGKAEEELDTVIDMQIDLTNFRLIYRLKKNYGANSDMVRSMVFEGGRIRSKIMVDMINAQTADEVLQIFLESTPYGRLINSDTVRYSSLETATALVAESSARKLMRSSVNPATVMLAYMILLEAEVRDVVTIIEGIHYGLSRESIIELITIDDLSK